LQVDPEKSFLNGGLESDASQIGFYLKFKVLLLSTKGIVIVFLI